MRNRATIWVAGAAVALVAGLSILIVALGHRATPTGPLPASPAPTGFGPTLTTRLGTAPPPPPTSTPGPLLYTVQPGDTLAGIAANYGVPVEELASINGLADPNLIYPGQILVIPGHSAPSAERPTAPGHALPADIPLPTMGGLTPEGPAQVEIVGVMDPGDLQAECVVIRNGGGPVNLEGWSLSGATTPPFIFPRLILFPQAEVRVCSRRGYNSPTEVYWGLEGPIWHSGDLVTLEDRQGGIVDTSVVP